MKKELPYPSELCEICAAFECANNISNNERDRTYNEFYKLRDYARQLIMKLDEKDALIKEMFDLLNEISRDPLMTCDQWGRVMELVSKIEAKK